MLDLENIHPQPYLFLLSVYSLLNQHHTVGNKELNKMEFSYLIVPQPFVELMLHPDKLFDDNVTNIAIIHILLEYEKLYPYRVHFIILSPCRARLSKYKKGSTSPNPV